jgi:hypothetical protein
MVGFEITHIAIAPPDVLDTALIGKVAVIINKDLYNTRLLLTGKIPKIIAHYASKDQADTVAQSLRTLGLTAMVFEDAELRKHSNSFRAYAAELGQSEILFSDRSSQTTKIGTDNTFLILKGIIKTHKETEITTTKTKLNIPLTALSGGIPIMRKVKEKAKEVTFREEYFLRFYDGKSKEPGIEILQNDFDYSSLGSQMGSSSAVNFNILVTNIIKAFPRAIFDDRLTKYYVADSASNTLNNTDINCRLIVSFYQAINSPHS